MITTHIQSDAVRSQLAHLTSLAEHPRPILVAASGAVAKLLRQHFAERDKEPNRLGGRRTHFWAKVAQSTSVGEITDQQGVVVISDPRFAQKFFGGVIKAGKSISSKTGKPTRSLAIPVAPEAHGLRPAQLEDKGIKLFVLGSEFGVGLLAGQMPGRKSRKGAPGAIKVFYVLKTSVTQAAAPEAMPPRDTIVRTAVQAAESYVRTRLRSQVTT